MPTPNYRTITSTTDYDRLLDALYMKTRTSVQEIDLPDVRVITVNGNEPPGSQQYSDAIGVLYGIGYGLKMGLKFEKIPRPKGWFDYRVGALETIWWSVSGPLRIDDPKTLRWQAYLMVPRFVSAALVEEARRQAKAKHAEVPYDQASLEVVSEGRAVQILHLGPYSAEQPTIDRLHGYIAEHGLAVGGRHHEIYISDPRRTKPEKIKTVIRIPVKAAGAAPKPAGRAGRR
jgi:hypothetical protein